MHQRTGIHPSGLTGATSREALIIEHVRGKDVLDCGAVDHWAYSQKLKQGCWLHGELKRHARTLVGFDILEEAIHRLRDLGPWSFVVADGEALPFVEQFDVVVGGEFIEHLHNPGLFLEQAYRALRPEGLLLLSTPNNCALSRLLYAVCRGREACHPEHTCYYSGQTITYMLQEHGFRLLELHYLPRPGRIRAIDYLYRATAAARPLLAEVLLVVAQKGERTDAYSTKW